MDNFLFNQISLVIDSLIAKGEKVTVSKVITASLFFAGGTLATKEKEVSQVVKMYLKGINEFEYTYKHNNKTVVFTLNINRHGVMCLGFKCDGKKYYQCAMDRHIEEQMQLIVVLSKTSKDELMHKVFIPNNIAYLNKCAEKVA